MNDSPYKMLLATDGSPDSVRANLQAAKLQQAFSSELHVVHVVPVSQPYSIVGGGREGPSFYEEDMQRSHELLEEEVRRVEEPGGRVEKAYLKTGEPDAEVISLAEEIGANLIVVGSRS